MKWDSLEVGQPDVQGYLLVLDLINSHFELGKENLTFTQEIIALIVQKKYLYHCDKRQLRIQRRAMFAYITFSSPWIYKSSRIKV